MHGDYIMNEYPASMISSLFFTYFWSLSDIHILLICSISWKLSKSKSNKTCFFFCLAKSKNGSKQSAKGKLCWVLTSISYCVATILRYNFDFSCCLNLLLLANTATVSCEYSIQRSVNKHSLPCLNVAWSNTAIILMIKMTLASMIITLYNLFMIIN